MTAVKIIFFFGIFITFYSYIGYGLVLWLWLKIKGKIQKPALPENDDFTLPVTLIVAAYNEEEFIAEKIANTLSLQYPSDKFHIVFITDGSTDNTAGIVSQYPNIQLLHSDGRKGKVAAMHRAMSFVTTPIVIFSDANTLLNADSIKNLVRHYRNPSVGGVAGEKKIMASAKGSLAGAGEGLYWKYESFLKKLDWQFYTVVGAAGELFSIRTELYEHPGDDTLLDDFVISLRICEKGYRVAYEPEAYAMETGSASIAEEQKRKIRISAGGFQSMYMLSGLLNIFKHGKLSFQYISHRVLRWSLCPLFLPLVLLANILIVIYAPAPIYSLVLAAQVLFYGLALLGWILFTRGIRVSSLYAAYYFVFINYSLYIGFFKYMKGRQSVLWEKSSRGKYIAPAGNPSEVNTVKQ
ncbi:MAG TPA: glycosyltransferase family 2 protein [Flavisolibacter sp.]|nr:glycosyltransferase family 2 protein [Flavisolibacter sp.]